MIIELREKFDIRVAKLRLNNHIYNTLALKPLPSRCRKWTDEEIKYLVDNNNKISDDDIAFNLYRTIDQVRRKIYHMRLRTSVQKYYTREEIDIILKYYRTHSHKEIGEMIGRSHWSVKEKLRTMGIKRSPEESRAIIDRCSKKGYYEKGHGPLNALKDGAITIRMNYKRGYIRRHIRISKGKWKELQIYNWEKKYGPIPKGMILACKSEDTLNCDPDNWKLITMKENLLRNNLTDTAIAFRLSQKGRGSHDPELREEILKHPEIIELKRQQLLLNRELNNG